MGSTPTPSKEGVPEWSKGPDYFCKTFVFSNLHPWRNWQPRMPQEHVTERSWGFDSSRVHQWTWGGTLLSEPYVEKGHLPGCIGTSASKAVQKTLPDMAESG